MAIIIAYLDEFSAKIFVAGDFTQSGYGVVLEHLECIPESSSQHSGLMPSSVIQP